jgi:hypothetical protein
LTDSESCSVHNWMQLYACMQHLVLEAFGGGGRRGLALACPAVQEGKGYQIACRRARVIKSLHLYPACLGHVKLVQFEIKYMVASVVGERGRRHCLPLCQIIRALNFEFHLHTLNFASETALTMAHPPIGSGAYRVLYSAPCPIPPFWKVHFL